MTYYLHKYFTFIPLGYILLCMLTLDVHTLLEGKKRKFAMSSDITDYLAIWKELMANVGEEPTLEDAFYAGFVISNNVVLRERFLRMKSDKKLIENTFGRKNWN